jgi:hypothetical protein
MPPVPAIPIALEAGQTRLSFNSPSIIFKKPGKLANPVYKVPPHLARRWLFGSAYKAGLARQFKTSREKANDPDCSDPERSPLHRNSYSRELKLAAIEWATNTWIPGKTVRDPDKRITRYAAAARLEITSKMLQCWIQERAKIASQPKASRRARSAITKGQEHIMEVALFKEFREARTDRKAVGNQ